MNLVKINCVFCGKEFFRSLGRGNEARKFGWKQYCSQKCLKKDRTRGVRRICANPVCNRIVIRPPSEIRKSRTGMVFCSQSCAAIVSNHKRRKSKICINCGKEFFGERKCCSKSCYNLINSKIVVSSKQITNEIKAFYKREKRIPVKREYHHYDAARLRFGTWNKAVKAAGFEPNPILFAKKFIAEDGHKCDSFSEKIIDDWLVSKNIKHKRNVPYPQNKSLTADFVVKDTIIEFFGLIGAIKRYDELVREKQNICRKYNLKLIEIYPKDLFPVNRLSEVLKLEIENT